MKLNLKINKNAIILHVKLQTMGKEPFAISCNPATLLATCPLTNLERRPSFNLDNSSSHRRHKTISNVLEVTHLSVNHLL